MLLHMKPTYLEQWNFSVQRQIGADWLLSATYMGNRTVHLWVSTAVQSSCLWSRRHGRQYRCTPAC